MCLCYPLYVETLRRTDPSSKKSYKMSTKKLENPEIGDRAQNRPVRAAEGKCSLSTTAFGTTISIVQTTYSRIRNDKLKTSWKACVLI
jgi:DNA-binding XRE family transcriptional regulator